MNKKILVVVFCVVAAVVLVSVLVPRHKAYGEFDMFAQCLADKRITMYGAAWCPHCQNEKAAFGDSFKFVPYVECPEHAKECIALGIQGYPTWIFPDGKKLVGEQGIEKLSQESKCELPQSKN